MVGGILLTAALICAAYAAGSLLRRFVDKRRERGPKVKALYRAFDMSRYDADYSGQAGILAVRAVMRHDADMRETEDPRRA